MKLARTIDPKMLSFEIRGLRFRGVSVFCFLHVRCFVPYGESLYRAKIEGMLGGFQI